MSRANIQKFFVFLVLYLIVVTIIQVYIFTSDDSLDAIIVKNIVSGIIASVIFVFLTRKKN